MFDSVFFARKGKKMIVVMIQIINFLKTEKLKMASRMTMLILKWKER